MNAHDLAEVCATCRGTGTVEVVSYHRTHRTHAYVPCTTCRPRERDRLALNEIMRQASYLRRGSATRDAIEDAASDELRTIAALRSAVTNSVLHASNSRVTGSPYLPEDP